MRQLLRLLSLLLVAAALLACRSESAADSALDAGGDTLSAGEIVVNGITRTYLYWVPDAAAAQPVPLVMVFHGGQGSGKNIARQSGFDTLARDKGFAVVFPDSREYWQDGRSTTGRDSNDIELVRSLIGRFTAAGIDPRRVYATGISNGGMFTLRLACEASDVIAAFAPVTASFPVSYAPDCKPGRPVPIMMFNGTDDEFILWRGGSIRKGRRRGAGGEVIPVPETVGFWRSHNGCAAEANTELQPDLDPDDGTRVNIATYPDCRNGSAVVLVAVEGGGHTWSGSDAPRSGLIARLTGNMSQDVDATESMWAFFREHALPR